MSKTDRIKSFLTDFFAHRYEVNIATLYQVWLKRNGMQPTPAERQWFTTQLYTLDNSGFLRKTRTAHYTRGEVS